QKELRSKSLENRTLHQRVSELFEEKTNMHKTIDELNQKLAVYEALKESFLNIESIKMKKEKRTIKVLKKGSTATSPKIDENNPNDEIFSIASFIGRPKKRANFGADEYEAHRKRSHMIDSLNKLSINDPKDGRSRFTRE
uniref:Uncharacterized protein n=1 Tax=Panagrolaimus sp. ES5 TaxID=591445 RepID=A0AC34GG77_9BILA